MGCPYHSNGNDEEATDGHADDVNDGSSVSSDRGIERRSFMKSALAIGGASALTTATGLYGVPETVSAEGGARIGAEARDNRQHAWDGFETDISEGGVTAHPSHHVTLHLNYVPGKEEEPSAADRATVEEVLREIERHFEWASEGVLFTIGYSPAYFDRFDADLPRGLSPKGKVVKPGLLRPKQLIDTPGVTLDHEDPHADEAEVCLHLASNNAQNIMAVEELLWGGEAEMDGDTVEFDATFSGVLETAGDGSGRPTEYPYRRTGFAGHETITEELESDTDFDPDRIPDDPEAELTMGFNDLYRNSIPREDNATILEDQNLVVPHPPGAFAQGTIQHVSKLDIDLDRFYDENDTEGRRERMFSPDHTDENTGTVGENLGDSSAPGDTPLRELGGETDKAEQTVDDYDDAGVAGHAQKLSRARFDLETRLTEEGRERLSGSERDEILPAEERDDDLDGHDGNQEAEQVLLRRDVATTDQQTPGNLFISLMRFNPYMAYIRQAMNGVEFDSKAFGLTGEDRIDDEKIGAGPDSGIVNYLETKVRGNYLVPPITNRALPHPQGEEVDVSVKRAGENYRVTVDGITADAIEDGSVRCGWFYDVNRAGGAEPRQVVQRGNRTTFVFPADGTGVDTAPGGSDGSVRVRFLAKRSDTGRPVRGTAEIPQTASGNAGQKGKKGQKKN
ncbi:hypothetical protein DJ82_09950 [Halorubrum sp. Ib24]|uniref:DUF7405 family protein n=1 Tax=unclassified Halorubrum TaxID=2642239 RepID=UPI000B99B53C|nr:MULTISPECIES: hypothetical protein [unclassified Halorubrum]OYR39257.1 hypothetical protein DJ82_09950 [Halorubrum sp. Ib24]OYR48957.1 hypothetical protein DJ75_01785 [Halorubrum sp. Eb13]OYR50695.1 hypothetical protein DJ73_15495 [Halorubrum sp. Ea1]